ncbi:ComEC/Rec2 family competence protein [Georgenia deserti]|uniref:ComEC/Rec2 family competence protein n=1 Tax=Georgenia deserti TaxID=2093781 RepID=A0ABW4L7R3_9MICO
MTGPDVDSAAGAHAITAGRRAGRGRDSGDDGPPPSPVDARLVPAALLSWAAALAAVAAAPATALAGAGACLAIAGIAAAALVRRRRTGGRHRAAPLAPPAGAVLLAAMVVAAVLTSTAAQSHARSSGLLADLVDRGAAADLTGRVLDEPQPIAAREWDDAGRFRVTVGATEVSGRGSVSAADAEVVVLGPGSWGDLALGEEIRVRATPTPTAPGEEAVALLSTDREPDRLARPPWHLRGVNHIRASLREAAADLPPDARGLVPGIAVGDDRAVPTGLTEDMRTTALTHLTAVSGAHVAIVLGTVLAVCAWMPRRARAVVGAVALVAFVALVRPEPSVSRSALMGAVVLTGLLLGRPSRALPALCTAVVLLLLADPWMSRSYGFALSVLATAGLVLLARPWARWLSHVMPRWLATVVAVPGAAQAACGPVVLLLQPALAPYAVPANVMAAPAVPPATVLGVSAALVASLWPAGGGVLAAAAAGPAWWIALAARTFAGLPGAALPWPGTVAGVLGLALLTALGLAALARVGPPRPRPWLPATIAAALLLVMPGPRQAVAGILPGAGPASNWVAAQCDVGQGSAFLLRSGPSAAVMVDVGPAGSDPAGCLTSTGTDRLDLLVLTHPHSDHVGALPEVLAAVKVDRALVSPATAPRHTVETVAAQLAAADVPTEVATADGGAAAGRSGAVSWEVLWPTSAAADVLPADAVNDRSVAVHLAAPELSAVALGDVELDGQAGVLRAVRAAGRDPPDVVVMAHHGSPRQHPGLAAALAPRVTLVSVGADNDYGHPAATALDLYRPHGAVLRTDECGPITLVARPELAVSAACPR